MMLHIVFARRIFVSGLLVMVTSAVASSIWPEVAVVVSAVFVVVLIGATTVSAALVVRWCRGELAWRRELRTMPPVDPAAYGAAPAAPPLADVRQSA